MTTVGIKSKAMEHTTHKQRKPREKKIDFAHLNIKAVEAFVGREAIGIMDLGKWVAVDFGNCTVSFRKWKSI